MSIFGPDQNELLPEDETESSEPVFEKGPACPACNGTGHVRHWSAIGAIAAMTGFTLCAYFLVRTLSTGSPGYMSVVGAGCVGVFGLVFLIDHDECKKCDGHGELDQEDTEDELANAEWAQDEPPE